MITLQKFGIILFCLVLIVFPHFSYSQKHQIAIAHKVDNIAVDGVLDDWPENFPEHKLDNLLFGEISSKSDFPLALDWDSIKKQIYK